MFWGRIVTVLTVLDTVYSFVAIIDQYNVRQISHTTVLHAHYQSGLTRRNIMDSIPLMVSGLLVGPTITFPANAVQESSSGVPGGLNVDDFLKSGQVAMPMGVSGQAGKSRPETGIVFREGSEISRDKNTGDVFTEILVGPSTSATPVVASFTSPWPLATGSVFDVECRDGKTGDGVFLSVTGSLTKSIEDTPSKFFTDELFKPTGRFAFYGPPTDVKIKKSRIVKGTRFIDLSFSTLSQSTQTEIPRNAILAATVPSGTDRAVVLVGSASANRWTNKGAGEAVQKVVDSFVAIPAPTTSMKVRPSVKGSSIADRTS